MKSRVAVIVLTHNNHDDTMECLESVFASACPDFDVLLVDNHSTDGSIERIVSAYPDLHLLRNSSNLGVAGGRNSGWYYAQEHFFADYLLFLDNDTVILPDTLSLLAGCLDAHPEVATACGKAYTPPPSTTVMSVGLRVNHYTGVVTDVGTGENDAGQYDAPGYVTACGGFCFMVKESVFAECAGLDDDYNPYGWEDVDFNLRALGKGYRCYYVPEAIVYHKGCRIGRGYVQQYEKYKVKHYFRLLWRHTNSVQKISCAVCVPARALLAVLKLIGRGELRTVTSQLRGAIESALGKT
jgi:GT2 family glycosyltransferase